MPCRHLGQCTPFFCISNSDILSWDASYRTSVGRSQDRIIGSMWIGYFEYACTSWKRHFCKIEISAWPPFILNPGSWSKLFVKRRKTENVFCPHVLWFDHNHMLSCLEYFQEVLKAEGPLKFFTDGTAPYISGFVFDKWLPHVIPTHKMLPHKEINLLTKITTTDLSVKTQINYLTIVRIDFYKLIDNLIRWFPLFVNK